jgi:hypothetical protein
MAGTRDSEDAAVKYLTGVQETEVQETGVQDSGVSNCIR